MELERIFEEKRAPILVNLGIGIPAFVSSVAAEENVTEFILTVLESGAWGGIALSGPDFGLAMSPFALSTIPDMFSNFEGGIIDAASLGFLQVDREGNVNPSMLPNRIFGPGGFPVIAGGAPRTYFAGAFTAGQAKIDIVNGKVLILDDGPTLKFIEKVFRVVLKSHHPSTRRAVLHNERQPAVQRGRPTTTPRSRKHSRWRTSSGSGWIHIPPAPTPYYNEVSTGLQQTWHPPTRSTRRSRRRSRPT